MLEAKQHLESISNISHQYTVKHIAKMVSGGSSRKVTEVWTRFRSTFLELWSDEELHKGQAYMRGMYSNKGDLDTVHEKYMNHLWNVSPTVLENSRLSPSIGNM